MIKRCSKCGKFYNPEKGHKCKGLTEDEIKKAIELYKQHISIAEIARRLGRSFEPIRKLIHKRFNVRKGYLHSRTIKIPDKLSLAYAAGFFDGEGYVGLNKHKYKNKTFEIAQLKIDNTCKEVINWFKSTFQAGSIRVDEREKKNPKHKTSYTWFLSRQLDILFFLKALLPFLKVKKIKAQKIIMFLEGRLYGKS